MLRVFKLPLPSVVMGNDALISMAFEDCTCCRHSPLLPVCLQCISWPLGLGLKSPSNVYDEYYSIVILVIEPAILARISESTAEPPMRTVEYLVRLI